MLLVVCCSYELDFHEVSDVASVYVSLSHLPLIVSEHDDHRPQNDINHEVFDLTQGMETYAMRQCTAILNIFANY